MNQQGEKQVVVVGGGISGLATAFQIGRQAKNHGFPVSVTLLERESHLGGRIHTCEKDGYRIETNRNGQTQIDFGHKKLHSGHLEQLFVAILKPGANVARVIESVAPGRPCTHRPMREILERIS